MVQISGNLCYYYDEYSLKQHFRCLNKRNNKFILVPNPTNVSPKGLHEASLTYYSVELWFCNLPRKIKEKNYPLQSFYLALFQLNAVFVYCIFKFGDINEQTWVKNKSSVAVLNPIIVVIGQHQLNIKIWCYFLP